jgi:hypothetical protein
MSSPRTSQRSPACSCGVKHQAVLARFDHLPVAAPHRGGHFGTACWAERLSQRGASSARSLMRNERVSRLGRRRSRLGRAGGARRACRRTPACLSGCSPRCRPRKRSRVSSKPVIWRSLTRATGCLWERHSGQREPDVVSVERGNEHAAVGPSLAPCRVAEPVATEPRVPAPRSEPAVAPVPDDDPQVGFAIRVAAVAGRAATTVHSRPLVRAIRSQRRAAREAHTDSDSPHGRRWPDAVTPPSLTAG